MTKEQFERLTPYSGVMYNAVYLNYARVGDSVMMNTLNEVSKEIWNISIEGGCSHCLMNHLKRIGKAYFDFKKTEEKRLELEAEEKARLEAEEKARLEKEELEKKIAEEGKVQPVNNNNRTNTKNDGEETKQKPKGTGRRRSTR